MFLSLSRHKKWRTTIHLKLLKQWKISDFWILKLKPKKGANRVSIEISQNLCIYYTKSIHNEIVLKNQHDPFNQEIDCY